MVTAFIILGILAVFIIGFVKVYNFHSIVIKNIDFASEYRSKFADFSKKYFKTYERWNYSGDVDYKLYEWLTMNVFKIQNNIGPFGIITYKPPFTNYMIDNYQIIINTLPKFRNGQVEIYDANMVDDCLLRYIGHLEEYRKVTQKDLRNPIVWFREGFREIMSIPIFILSWFGIISNQTVNSINNSSIYKVISGLIALVTLVSSVVTIIVGYDQTIEFVNRLFGK